MFFGYNSVTLQTDIGHGHVRDFMEKKRFCFILYSKFRQKLSEGESSQRAPRLVVYPLPARDYRYPIKAWEWTVYFGKGVWRCLE